MIMLSSYVYIGLTTTIVWRSYISNQVLLKYITILMCMFVYLYCLTEIIITVCTNIMRYYEKLFRAMCNIL